MLISLMPTAFAASNNYGSFSGETDSKGYCYLIGDADFDEESLYKDPKAYYFTIESDENDAPGVYHDDYSRSVEGRVLDYEELDGVYFDEYYSDCDETYYSYTIEAYEDEDCDDYVGYMTFKLYVNGSSSNGSSDGDIYAETDRDDELDIGDISDEILDYAKDALSGDPYYVQFESWTNGTMYDGEAKTEKSDEYYFYKSDVGTKGYYLDDAWFEADDPSKESIIKFYVYSEEYADGKNGYSRDYASGTIIVNGDGSSTSGDIKYETEYNTSVTFDADDFEDLVPSGYSLDEVSFTPPSSSKGTLYTTSSEKTAVSSRDTFDSDELDEVTFAPKTGVTGNVSISFSMSCVKSRSNTRTVRGTVVISIADGTTITYTGEVDEEVEFDADDFEDVCSDVTGRDLDYVKFSLPTSSKGTLYAEYDGTSKGSTTAKSSDKFYVDPGKNEYGLDDVVFVPKTSGTVELTYTAYNTRGTSFTGKVKITTTAGALRDISYSVTGTSGVTFKASDFTAALKAKTSKALSSVTFTLPRSTEGVLYYNGTTRVSASTQYKATGSTNSLDKVSFVPASTASGSVKISYTAKDTSGNSYSGAVVVKTFVGEDTVITYSTTGTAAPFKTSDFTNACAKKLGTTLSYVQFSLPNASQGTLYYGWGSENQKRVTANTKYTAAVYLPYVSFVPKAGFSGTATVVYTGYDTAGSFYIGKIEVTVTPPARSASFTDANASWVAPSADFLQANGVYSGVVSGSTLGVGTAITRGQVMQMIYNGFNLKNKVSSVTSNFTDVPASHANYTAINAGYALGIAQGYAGAFRPDEPITRQDACTLLYRAFTVLGLNMSTGSANDLASFADRASVDNYAVDAVAGMVKSGIIVGDNNGINPKGNLTRGEMSVIVHRAMTL